MKVALVLCLLVARAAAEPVTIPKSKALLDVPKTWTRLPDDPSLAVAFKKDASVLAVTRAAVPNISAWIPKSRDAYLQEVERGAIAAVPGTKKLARAFALINNVPTLDLELRRPAS